MADKLPKLTTEQKEALHKLNPRQQKFVFNLVEGMNQTEAYRKAGYKPRSESNARIQASKMVTRGNIKDAIDALKNPNVEKQATRAILTRERALEILTHQAECTLDQVVHTQDVTIETMDGPVVQTIMRIKDSDNLSERAKASIKAVTITAQGPKVELQDRKEAIKLIAQMEGWDKASDKDMALGAGLTGAYESLLNASKGRPPNDPD